MLHVAEAPATPDLLAAARRVHFVGIGGAGMCALAEVLLRRGFAVAGSDLVASAATRRLAALGAEVYEGHAAEAVCGADLVVASSAIDAGNVELTAARASGIPIVARGTLLAALMHRGEGIAVAGSHGKTTTASLIAAVLVAAELDPTFLIGGRLHAVGGNARCGLGRHLVAEADESDASFLQLRPRMAVVTNVDADHLDAYGQRFECLQAAFAEFVGQLPEDGVAALCADDPAARALAGPMRGRVVTYGLAPGADLRGVDLAPAANGCAFTAVGMGSRLALRLPLPGDANVRNALGAVATCLALGVAPSAIAAGIEGFAGVERRFQLAECEAAGKRFTLVDDYGHHPTELAHVIETVRRHWPERRLVMAYQPHRYSRTRDLLASFAAELAGVDALVLAEVYAASEPSIPGADSAALATAVAAATESAPPQVVATPTEALDWLRAGIADGDVVAVQGAGDIGTVAATLRGET